MLKINQLYFIGYLHTLKLVSLVRVSWLVWLPAYLEPRALLVCAGWSGYLHALNLVSWLVCPWFVSWLVWLPACLEPRALLVRVLVGVVTCMPWTSCPWFVPCWFVSWLEVVTCIPWTLCPGWCGYLHTLNLVPAGWFLLYIFY